VLLNNCSFISTKGAVRDCRTHASIFLLCIHLPMFFFHRMIHTSLYKAGERGHEGVMSAEERGGY
jgi:hypothetical protein